MCPKNITVDSTRLALTGCAKGDDTPRPCLPNRFPLGWGFYDGWIESVGSFRKVGPGGRHQELSGSKLDSAMMALCVESITVNHGCLADCSGSPDGLRVSSMRPMETGTVGAFSCLRMRVRQDVLSSCPNLAV